MAKRVMKTAAPVSSVAAPTPTPVRAAQPVRIGRRPIRAVKVLATYKGRFMEGQEIPPGLFDETTLQVWYEHGVIEFGKGFPDPQKTEDDLDVDGDNELAGLEDDLDGDEG